VLRDRRRRRPWPRARARRREPRGRLRAHRHLYAGIRHARELARRRRQRPHRAPRPGRGRHVREGRERERQHARHARAGQGGPLRATDEPRAPSTGGLRGASRRLPRRGDRDAGRGAGPCAHHDRRQPGAEHPERRPPRARARRARVHGEPRHLRERDDAPRRRHPARPLAARAVALRPGAPPARHPQRGDLLAARVRPAGGTAPRVGDAAPSRRPRGRPGAGAGHGGARRLRHAPARRARGGLAGVADPRARVGGDHGRARPAPRPGAT